MNFKTQHLSTLYMGVDSFFLYVLKILIHTLNHLLCTDVLLLCTDILNIKQFCYSIHFNDSVVILWKAGPWNNRTIEYYLMARVFKRCTKTFRFRFHFAENQIVIGQCKTQTAHCRLQTGVKCELKVKCRLQTTDFIGIYFIIISIIGCWP